MLAYTVSKEASLAELLLALYESTIGSKSQIDGISWEQAVALKEFFEEDENAYWSLHSWLTSSADTFTFIVYTV